MGFSDRHNATRLEVQRLESIDPDDRFEQVSEPIVMSNDAGWYVGQVYRDSELGCLLPWSRNSDFMTESMAIQYFDFDINGAQRA